MDGRNSGGNEVKTKRNKDGRKIKENINRRQKWERKRKERKEYGRNERRRERMTRRWNGEKVE